MQYFTGETIYEQIISVDADNNPVPTATFDIESFKDGSVFSGLTINTVLTDSSRGIFSASFSADTTGNYQIFFRNNITNVIFMTDIISVKTTPDINIYVGL